MMSLPQIALDALHDLLESLKRQGVKDARVDYLPNGNIVCRWETDAWMASATISAELQIIRLIACKEQK